MNLTRTVKKAPINKHLNVVAAATEDRVRTMPKYDEEGTVPEVTDEELSAPITKAHYHEVLDR